MTARPISSEISTRVALALAGILLGIIGTFLAYSDDIKQIPVIVTKLEAVEEAVRSLTNKVDRIHPPGGGGDG